MHAEKFIGSTTVQGGLSKSVVGQSVKKFIEGSGQHFCAWLYQTKYHESMVV